MNKSFVIILIAQTQSVWTPIPTWTPDPTYTPKPAVTRLVVQTPTPLHIDSSCKPMTDMAYTDNSLVTLKLMNYVSGLPNVKTVSYVLPEKLYSNSLSQLYHVTYVSSSDGKVYSKRYIVFMKEFSWRNGVFSIDGQCWIDPPK
jgi:hypothetical protein